MAYTPGPWKVTKCPCGDPVCDGYYVSAIGYEGRLDKETAHLIAAAPEMYEALKKLTEYVAFGGVRTEMQMADMITGAHKALAKAEGRHHDEP